MVICCIETPFAGTIALSTSQDYTPLMDTNQIIDALGGTSAVARLCEIRPPSVSGWLARGRIPKARLMYLKLARPDVFGKDAKKLSAGDTAK
jgi:hypothetical protein